MKFLRKKRMFSFNGIQYGIINEYRYVYSAHASNTFSIPVNWTPVESLFGVLFLLNAFCTCASLPFITSVWQFDSFARTYIARLLVLSLFLSFCFQNMGNVQWASQPNGSKSFVLVFSPFLAHSFFFYPTNVQQTTLAISNAIASSIQWYFCFHRVQTLCSVVIRLYNQAECEW